MSIRLTVLCENNVNKVSPYGLLGEHGFACHLQSGGSGTLGMDFKVGECDSAGPACSQGLHGGLLRSETGGVVGSGVLARFAGIPFGRGENSVPKLFSSLFKGFPEPIHIDEVDAEPRWDVF